MQCTPQQIEEKRRQAQLKLAAKLNQNKLSSVSPIKTYNNESINYNNKPTSNITPNKATNVFNRFNNPASSKISPSSSIRNHNSKPYEKFKQTPMNFYGNNKVVTGTCYLISENRFACELSSYCQQAIEVFKTVPSRSYNMNTRIWDFHVSDYDLLQNKMNGLQPDIVIGKIPSYALNCVKAPKNDYSLIDLSKIDSELSRALMPFQVEGVCFGIDKRGRCLIADDMGLGKTFQAIAIASYYRDDWPLLIATTASMKNTWEETIIRYLSSVSVMHVQYMTSAKDYIGDARILIVSHDLMGKCLDKLLEKNFGVMIIDESHIFKNFKAKCTKAATDLSKKAKRIILLSGTPALSRPSELYTQLSLIDHKFFGNFINYSKRYCDGKTTNFGWDASGKSNLQELEIILTKKFMIRRTKEDVLRNLPDKSQEVITLDVNLNSLSSDDRKALNALALKYKSERKGNEKHALLLTFFSETAKIKIPSVCSYILQVLEEKTKFLIFGHHQIMLNALEEVLVKKKKKFIRIDGNTSSEYRKGLVDRFQTDDNYCCAILSITAANAGITLTAAQLVIFAELHWNPSILSQAEARAHRIGQENKVVVRYLLAPGTADDSIWPMLQGKQKILKEIGISKDSFNEVAVTAQTGLGASTNGLNSSITSANTLDISAYFKSPVKSENTNNQSEKTSEEVEDFFNDDLDEALSSVDVNF